MRKILGASIIALALVVGSVPVQAQTAPTAAPASAGTPKYSSSKTTLATLLADPAAKAVLVAHIPQIAGNGDISGQAGGMTLRELQDATRAYSADMLSDKVLAEIDADLAKIK